MAFNKIKALLMEKIGLHADTIGVSSIERAISHRMENVKLSSASKYYSLIKNDPKEFGELIEEVVVPETWFLRNKSPFEALRKFVTEMEFLKQSPDSREPLKILSLPCATGEEPYSIAITLREAGLGKDDFCIDGVDVSKRALTKAKRAIYGKHSFREPDTNIQEKYFKKTRSGFQLLPEIHDHVTYVKANVMEDNISPSVEYYDIIFCRNLLIYFDRKTQNIVLDKIKMLLKPDGYLFVGHAETANINKKHFVKTDYPKSFSYRKRLNVEGHDKRHQDPGPVNKLKNIYDQLVEVTRKDTLLSKRIIQPKKVAPKRVPTAVDASYSWSKLENLIDSGHYDEATSVCEKMLIAEPENADGYYYLGLISNLRGSYGGAESLLKKAIYLSPNHQRALCLSVLLAERRGDAEGASYYRRREDKARERNK